MILLLMSLTLARWVDIPEELRNNDEMPLPPILLLRPACVGVRDPDDIVVGTVLWSGFIRGFAL